MYVGNANCITAKGETKKAVLTFSGSLCIHHFFTQLIPIYADFRGKKVHIVIFPVSQSLVSDKEDVQMFTVASNLSLFPADLIFKNERENLKKTFTTLPILFQISKSPEILH